jgi:hypothetical protein
MLTTNLYLVPKLIMSGAALPLPLYVLIAWTGTTLTFLPLFFRHLPRETGENHASNFRNTSFGFLCLADRVSRIVLVLQTNTIHYVASLYCPSAGLDGKFL